MGYELACSLEGMAREVLTQLPADRCCDYRELKNALTNRFAPGGREVKYVIELGDRVMHKGEDAVSYGNALKKLYRDAYPGKPLTRTYWWEISCVG